MAAGAHLTPFMTGGDLRAAVRDGLAASIAAPAPLPSSGAAVAFVGAGGSGKSRCTAALAAAYARASTLRAGVVTLGNGAHGDDVAELLDGRGVPVTPGDGQRGADAVLAGRERGLVILDTPGVSPVDGPGVAALAHELGELALDAVYVAVPATLSATAARSLLDGLAPLSPTALAITHADETDALGIATELAFLSGLPIAFVHAGTTLEGGLARTDPRAVAARILP